MESRNLTYVYPMVKVSEYLSMEELIVFVVLRLLFSIEINVMKI